MTSQPDSGDGEMIRTTFGAVTEELQPGLLVVRLSGEIDIATTEFAAESIRAAIAPPARLVLIDVSAVTGAIDGAKAPIAAIGAAVLVVLVGVKVYKWIRRAL